MTVMSAVACLFIVWVASCFRAVENSQNQQGNSSEFLVKSDKRATFYTLWLSIDIKKKSYQSRIGGPSGSFEVGSGSFRDVSFDAKKLCTIVV